MPITRRTDYAVRMMYELAQLPPGATLSLRDLCELAQVPDSFGATIAAFLVESHLIRRSGYRDYQISLARPAMDITMAEVILACEPGFSLSQCAREPESCSRSPHCGVHTMWASLDHMVMSRLESVTLAHVARGQAFASDTDTLRAALEVENSLTY
ncbi:RrF2 family transcriptional regulator [Anaerosoma tenue]|uniref:RrF2 family transcriptional regulator n=1 Tax=Anaerosoma tenue TaxID=2933588 RepID=UPI002260DDC7|nr:Rrf2 family transcriptional regulator [Anaerosoma tenue]MCK8115309.1 Rrf2 family transcriptional regulator [Anaerosoma tenue]